MHRLWGVMVDYSVADQVHSHPIIIISSDFYPESDIPSYFIRHYRGDRVYIIPPEEFIFEVDEEVSPKIFDFNMGFIKVAKEAIP